MEEFTRFGPSHFAALAIIAAAAFAAARFGRHPRGRPWVRWGTTAVLAGSVLAFYLAEWLRGTLTGWDFLPFHLSDFAVFLAIFALITLRRRAAELLYFFSIAAVFALVTPDLARGFAELRTQIFFLLHGATLVAACALTFGFGLAPERGAVVRALAALNLYALFAAALNFALGTNFLYLRRKPSQASLLDRMGAWPWYILAAELLAACLFILAHLPFVRRPIPDE